VISGVVKKTFEFLGQYMYMYKHHGLEMDCTSGDHERELPVSFYHCWFPRGGGVFLPSHNKIHDTHIKFHEVDLDIISEFQYKHETATYESFFDQDAAGPHQGIFLKLPIITGDNRKVHPPFTSDCGKLVLLSLEFDFLFVSFWVRILINLVQDR
jgi:hypothetical protein